MSRVGASRDETGQQVLKSFHLRNGSSVSSESRSRCEIKLWLQWFEVQARACCAAPLSEGSRRGWIDCRSYMEATLLASPHNRLIMWRLKLSSSTYCGPRRRGVTELSENRENSVWTQRNRPVCNFSSCWGPEGASWCTITTLITELHKKKKI